MRGMANPQAVIDKLQEIVNFTTRELATIVTMDEDAQQATVAGGAVVKAKVMMEEALALAED